jgi:hypothetical protein
VEVLAARIDACFCRGCIRWRQHPIASEVEIGSPDAEREVHRVRDRRPPARRQLHLQRLKHAREAGFDKHGAGDLLRMGRRKQNAALTAERMPDEDDRPAAASSRWRPLAIER